MKLSRRSFSLSGGALTLAFLLDGKILNLTPAEAKAQNLPLRILTEQDAATLDLLGDAIVPGAAAAGLSRYIDHQLSVDSRDNLLILRYLRVNPPFDDFYISALRAFRQASGGMTKTLPDFITVMMRGNPDGWTNAPPAPLFYFALRSDAIDVTYGTMAGFERLDIPYMAHIEPAHPWEVDT